MRRRRAFVPSGGERPLEGRRMLSASPYLVPLQLVNVKATPAGAGATSAASKKAAKPEYKLGIYVGLGGDSSPRLYEFDTGGAGFWAASDKRSPEDLKWWGRHKVVGRKTLSISYSSGNKFTANKVKTSVDLYQKDADGGFTKVVGTGQAVDMGQIVGYTNSKNKAAVKAWDRALKAGAPPLQRWFYGDFGVSLSPAGKDAKNSIMSIVPQIPIPAGLTIGFIIHVGDPAQAGNQPYVQVGLTTDDLKSFDTTLEMNPYTGTAPRFFPVTGVNAYSARVTTADFTWTDARTGKSQSYNDLGWTIDTGASKVTVWQGADVAVQRSFLHRPSTSNGLHVGPFKRGSTLRVRADSIKAGEAGVDLTIDNDSSKGVDDRLVANYHSKSAMGQNYVNTGFYTFTQYDVMYNLQAGTISFRTPQPPTQTQTQDAAQG
jgi:hypothetical protein